MRDLAGMSRHGGTRLSPCLRLSVVPSTVVRSPRLILSPKFTHSDPDGFNTRTHSVVHAHSASRNACGVASDPICPS